MQIKKLCYYLMLPNTFRGIVITSPMAETIKPIPGAQHQVFSKMP